ncbi:MAG TPA: biotin--[acetyl-CoA-carboxylase] ligase [Nitrospiria bacterium]
MTTGKKAQSRDPNPEESRRLDTAVIQRGLRTDMIGRSIHYFPEIESTNAEAASMARGASPEGTVVIADAQTRGRGRMGREWVSPPDRNLYLSVILRPDRHPDHLGIWTLGAALATARAVRLETGLDAGLKWPNDLRIQGKKIAGLLIETAIQGPRLTYLVLGIGINVNMMPRDFPEPLRTEAGSLAGALGRTIDRNALCRTLLRELDDAYKTFLGGHSGDLLKAYRLQSETLGERVRVQLGRKFLEGDAVDFSDNGGLIVKTDDGALQTISADEIIHVREDRAARR